tara:strand:+ start:349 stop:564 length:216 start_codon:yes stop_codon:yes gene_type:complete
MTIDTDMISSDDSLILLKKGIYMNASPRGKRVHLDGETPALIIDQHGSYARVAIEGDKILLVHEKCYEKTN